MKASTLRRILTGLGYVSATVLLLWGASLYHGRVAGQLMEEFHATSAEVRFFNTGPFFPVRNVAVYRLETPTEVIWGTRDSVAGDHSRIQVSALDAQEVPFPCPLRGFFA